MGSNEAVPGCHGTLTIQPGAVLTVTGTISDSFVIGRDSSSGRVNQNGGTFTFNPANNGTIYWRRVGSATRSDYNMSGGLLDMSQNTLGLGLGAGVLITGLVNQVSGVITNVGNLWVGWGNGHGDYTLNGGSIYIGSNTITHASGITTTSGNYEVNLGGGTVGAYASWASSLNMTLTGFNGPVTFDTAGNTITLSGALSGNGGLTVAGTGTLKLSGANTTYTGDTAVNTGSTLELDASWSAPTTLRLANGSTLNLNYSGNYTVLGCYTNGVALPSGTYNNGNLPSFITGSGNLVVGAAVITQTVGFTADTTQEQYGNYQNANGGLLNIGRQMTVTGSGIEVFQLGFFDYQSDGLATAHTVTLFNSAANAHCLGDGSRRNCRTIDQRFSFCAPGLAALFAGRQLLDFSLSNEFE